MSMARGAEDKKQPATRTEEQTNKELQSETWETEPLMKDEAAGGAGDSQVATRAAPDLLPPNESGLAKLFSCCLWWQHTDD